MNRNKKLKWVYLVYCNKEPIVYAVYLSKKKALDYALYLLEYRKNFAKDNEGYTFDYYHYVTEEKQKETDYNFREKLIFSACLKIMNENNEPTSEDGCYVKVVRRNIS